MATLYTPRTARGADSTGPRQEVRRCLTSFSRGCRISAGDAYLGTVTTTLDQGQSYAQTTRTVQTQDAYGNVMTTDVYDYGNLSTPARQYVNTYKHTSDTH